MRKKLRSVAKKVKGDKQFKRLISEYLAKIDILTEDYNIKLLLTVGNRGYLAMSEKELCDRFDKKVESISKKIEKIKANNDDDFMYSWDAQHKLKAHQLLLKEADTLYDAIFEKVML